MKRLRILIVHNIRSCHNVGSLLRTAECLGVKKVYLSGYTPYPINDSDNRLPHIATKVHNKIAKTSLGSEKYIEWEHKLELTDIVSALKHCEYQIVALEQSDSSQTLSSFQPNSNKVALLLGNEINGLSKQDLALCDNVVEIPMAGKKKSLNVVQAAAIAIYKLSIL